MEFLKNVFGAYGGILGGTAGALVVLYFLLKLIVQHLLERDLKEYFSRWDFIASVYKERLSLLATERAAFVKELYTEIVLTHRYLRNVGGTGEEKETAEKLFLTQLIALRDKFYNNRIYLDEPLAEKMDELLSAFSATATLYRHSPAMYATGGSHAVEFHNVLKLQNEKTRGVLVELEKEFRKLIGSSFEIPSSAALFGTHKDRKV